MSTVPIATMAALAEPTRLQIVDMLTQQNELAASDISKAFSSSQSAISQHLKVLREAGLVTVQKRAQQRVYRLDPAPMAQTQQWLNQRIAQWNMRLDTMEMYLAQAQRNERKDHK